MASDQIPKFSVSDFVASINQTLEYAYSTVVIEGEVSSFKVNQGKWVFFDLKDESASVGCFMTVFNLRVPIEDGMRVIVRATPKLTAWGKFSLTIQSIRPSGEGSLKKSFDLLRAKLDKEGLFAIERKRPLPETPRYIGVISSTQAAGYADFIKILNDRWGGVRVDVAHVQVQGDSAPEQIIRAIRYFNQLDELPEVLVIIRGGGSADDLATFNDEPLVREIAASRTPTLVGVGHEVDVTLADMVADKRAVTPSEAAQIVVPDRRDTIRRVGQEMTHILSRIDLALDSNTDVVDEIIRSSFEMLNAKIEEVSVDAVNLSKVLKAFNPQAILERGYAIVRGDMTIGAEITIELKRQMIIAEVSDVREK